MKKGTIFLAVVIALSPILTSCASDSEETPASSSATVSESTSAPAESPTDEPETSTADSDSAQAPAETDGLSVETLISEDGESRLEYLQVSGLADQTVSDRLNSELQVFFTWPLIGSDGTTTYSNTANYAIIGDQYISVRSVLSTTIEGGAYPGASIQTNIFSLTTGEPAGSLSDFISVGEDLKTAINSGVFTQKHPEEPVADDAMTTLATEIVDSPVEYDTRFYLTADSFGLYLPDLPHAVGDYWTFEAKYTDIEAMLTDNLKSALGL